MYGGKFAFQIRLGWLAVGRKLAIFALLYFVFEGKFQVQASRGAYIWRGLYMQGLIFGILPQQVPPCRGIQDWIPFNGFRILSTVFQSLSVELGSWIPIVSGIQDSSSYILDSKAQESGFPYEGDGRASRKYKPDENKTRLIFPQKRCFIDHHRSVITIRLHYFTPGLDSVLLMSRTYHIELST